MRWLRGMPLAGVRWVVVDTETSGLDAVRDRLLSVGAVVVRGGRVELAESFHRRLRQQLPSSPENIVIHGIGTDAQLGGDPAGKVLAELSAFLGEGRPVGFNASFDEAVLRKAGRSLGVRLPGGWLDLAALAPVLEPRRGHRSLDEWLEAFGIRAEPRHDALADAVATAEFFLVLLEKARQQGCTTDRGLLTLAGAARWLR